MSQFFVFGRHPAGLLGALCFLAALAAWPVQAQTASQAQDRAQLLRTPATLRDDPTDEETGTDDAHAVASPNDPDLGEQAILKRSENYQPFTLFASVPISYTSNVALVRTGEESDVLIAPVVGFSYAPRITKTLYGNIGVAQQFFYYDSFTEFDFASFDFRAGLTYILPKFYNLLLRADYGYNRLTSDDLSDEFFSNHLIAFGAELPFRIGRAQQITIGTDSAFSLASDPDQPARHDYGLFVGYSANLTRSLTVSTVARLAVRDYVEGDRTDVSGIFALNAQYRFNKFLSLNGSSTFATNDSNQEVFSYDVFNIGGALSLGLRY